MKFKISEKVFDKFPNLVEGIVILRNINNKIKGDEAIMLLRDEEAKIRERFANINLAEHKNIKPWKEAFTKFSPKPGQYASSIEALLRRVKNGNPLPDINPIVNLYNYCSIKHLLPFGGEDLKGVYGNMELKICSGNEEFIPIMCKENKAPDKGEIAWADAKGITCRNWNWRQCNRTKITEDTTNGYFIIDALEPVGIDDIKNAANDLMTLAKEHFGADGEMFILDESNPEFEVDYETRKLETEEKIESKKPAFRSSKGAKDKTKVKSLSAETPKEQRTDQNSKLYVFPDGSIACKIQQSIKETLKSEFNIDMKAHEIHLEIPKDKTHGDYASNIAMYLTKKLKRSPRTIAQEILDKFEIRIPRLSDTLKSEIAGPGFINFKIGYSMLIDELKNLSMQERIELDTLNNKNIICEFTDPNPFKQFHIGHLYSNSMGESIARLNEALGGNVKRACYQGDVGMHVSKSIWGLMEKMKDEDIDIETLESWDLPKRIKYLGQSYATGATAFKEDAEAKEEIKDINYLVYISGQNNLVKQEGWTPQVDYKKYLKDSKFNLDEIEKIYQKGRSWSLEYFETIYRRLGTKFDYYFFESVVGEYGAKIVKEYFKKGLFEKSKGAIVFKGEEHGLHTRVFINSLGLPVYEAKDLGLAPTKYKKFKYDKSIIITANEINEYFKVILKVLGFIHPELARKTTHIGHGMVRLPEGKMSSRTGKVITGEQLINETKTRIKKIIDEGDRIPDSDTEEISEILAIGAIKYAFLKSRIGGDIIFDFDESLNFEGNSGPYIQYTYARCKSILSKAKEESDKALTVKEFSGQERSVMRHLIHFEETILEAGTNLTPHIICTYLFDLCQKFNSFYQSCPILKAEEGKMRLRIKIVRATSNVLQQGLHLLGIKTVEKM